MIHAGENKGYGERGRDPVGCRRALGVSALSALADSVKQLVNYSALTCHHMMCGGENRH